MNAEDIKYSVDFTSFDCPKCYYTNRVCSKDDEDKEFWFCSFCGEKLWMKNSSITK